MNAIVVVDRFPNVYESYVLNQIEFTILSGGHVSVISGPPLGNCIDSRIAKYGLISRCYPQSLDSLSDWSRMLGRAGNPLRSGARVSRGLSRLYRSGAARGLNGTARLRAAVSLGLLGSEVRYDVVHAYNMRQAYRNLFISKALQIPLVVSFLGLQTTDLGRPFFLSTRQTQEVFEHAAIVMTLTRYAESMLRDFGCPPEKVRVVPLGVPLAEFPYQPTSFDGSRRVRVLTVARLSPEKGHADVLSALRIVRERGWDVEYRIVGNGPYREALKRFIVEQNAGDFAHLVGEKGDADLVEEYRTADIFVLASKKEAGEKYYGETQGLVIQEALASGKLVVATDVGGIPECVENGQSAFLVPEGNPDGLAEAITRLLRNPDSWRKWQRAGREWVERHFSMDVVGPGVMDVYREAKAHGGMPR